MEQQTLQLEGETAGQKTAETEIKIETLKPFKVTTPNGFISASGIYDLRCYLACCNFPDLPDDFEYVWTTRRGTLPKRIQNYYFKEKNLKLGPEGISEIGNIAKKHASNEETYILDFDDKITWRNGQFGDAGSCYWGDKSDALDMIRKNGYAVRAWKRAMSPDSPNPPSSLAYENLKGYARAWLAPIGGNRFIVFNGYGETTLTFARILAFHWKVYYKNIDLTNNGISNGTLWLNGSEFVIGEAHKIEAIHSHDLGWEDRADTRSYCEECEDRFDDGDLVTAIGIRGRELQACGDCCSYCETCSNYYTCGVIDDECESCCESRREAVAEAEAEAEANRTEVTI